MAKLNLIREILSKCKQFFIIGDGMCNNECNLAETYYDGGDCLSYDMIDCDDQLLGNGRFVNLLISVTFVYFWY